MFGIDAFLGTYRGATGMNIASTLFGAFSSATRAKQEREFFNYRAAQLDELGSAEIDVGEVAAARLRRQGAEEVSSIAPAYAAGGVSIASGSVGAVRGELARRAELDALSAILEGKRRGSELRVGASQARMAADNARRSGYMNVGASLLGGYARQSEIEFARRRGSGLQL
jgi:hypothetical protein